MTSATLRTTKGARVRTSTHRNRHIEFWVGKAAKAIVHAQEQRGDDAVDERIHAAISREDYETTARVLRILAREFGNDEAQDLTALDERLRSLAGIDAAAAQAADESSDDAGAAHEPAKKDRPKPMTKGHFPKRAEGLRSSMKPKRR